MSIVVNGIFLFNLNIVYLNLFIKFNLIYNEYE